MKELILGKLKAVGRFVLYGFVACFLAVSYGYVTYPPMYALIVEGHVFQAYLFNLWTIMIFLLFDKMIMSKFIMSKIISLRVLLSKNLLTKIIRACLLPKVGLMSFKSGLYLFYIYVLLMAKLVQSGTIVNVSDSFELYIITMEYGLVMLVAVDMFIKQIITDHGRIKDMGDMERVRGDKSDEQKK